MAEIQNIKQNYLSPLEFRFVLDRLPYTTFFTQNITLPGISLSPVRVPNPFKALYHSSDTLEYDQLSIQFRVDENMRNYDELYRWALGLAFPSEFEEFANLKNGPNGLYSDATVIIMSNSRNPNIQYKFKNVFPINLSSLEMDTTQGDVDYIIANATFQIESYEISTGNSS